MKKHVLMLWLILTCLPVLFIAGPAWAEAVPLPGKNVWLMPVLKEGVVTYPCRVVVWFDRQFLEDGGAYRRKAAEFSGWKRSDMRRRVVAELKRLNDDAWRGAQAAIETLVQQKKIDQVDRHWIINGFSCRVSSAGALAALTAVPGVSKVFARVDDLPVRTAAGAPSFYPAVQFPPFHPEAVVYPWYVEKLGADRVWREFGCFGQQTINVIHDSNFVMTAGLTASLYRKPGEVPANGKDDDGNGLADDVHGFNFDDSNANLTPLGDPGSKGDIGEPLHGFLCASIICGPGQGEKPWVSGIAPRGQWAGVIGHGRIEDGVEWAAEIGADTYNMSFSLPGLGQYRSHWRKVIEQGAFCGIVFISGAGNFAREGSRNFAPVPVQMRIPEDIPDAVIAAAGVRQDLVRPPFSSQGPVQWQTDYYREGTVDKPDVSTFNANLPVMTPDGVVQPQGVSGNSFAGAMLSGAVALILSVDPEILPWDLRDIIVETAADIGPAGFDYQTGHGLVNCHRAVQEVLRRKASPAAVQTN